MCVILVPSSFHNDLLLSTQIPSTCLRPEQVMTLFGSQVLYLTAETASQTRSSLLLAWTINNPPNLVSCFQAAEKRNKRQIRSSCSTPLTYVTPKFTHLFHFPTNANSDERLESDALALAFELLPPTSQLNPCPWPAVQLAPYQSALPLPFVARNGWPGPFQCRIRRS
jgi:hypothetical protein